MQALSLTRLAREDGQRARFTARPWSITLCVSYSSLDHGNKPEKGSFGG